MATKTRARKVKVAPVQRIRKGQLQDPTWEGAAEWDGQTFHRARQSASEYYYKNYKSSDLIEYIWSWMLANGYKKDDVKFAKADPKHNLHGNVGYLCRMLTMGMPDFSEAHNEYWKSLPGTLGEVKPVTEYIIPKIDAAIANGKPIVKTQIKEAEAVKKLQPYKPSIQELMREACIVMSEEIDEFIDNFGYDKKELADFDPLRILRAQSCKMSHARVIRKFFEAELEEIEELNKKVSKADMDEMREQLEEGYSHLTASQKKMLLDLLRKVVNACDIIAAESKIQRTPRKVKAKSPTDLVKKLKFKASDPAYGIASVTPESIIGANILVVFNTKNRKLGVYYASNVDPKGLMRDGSGLGVKGTTITGYDEKRSIQKTIRKPEEFLAQIKKTTRSKTEKLFETVKTTETKLNGRINAETIILATFNK